MGTRSLSWLIVFFLVMMHAGIRTSPPTVLSTFIREVRWLQELLKMKIKPETLEGALIFKLKLGLLSW